MSSISLEMVSASEIEPEEIEWLWYPFIPLGKVTLLQGDPGDGKSTFILSIAALLSNGKALPFTEMDDYEPVNIIYQTTEDDSADTVVPRFIRAGGDRSKLHFIKEDKAALSFGDERIPEAINRVNAKLVILDPLSSYIGESCSINSANEVRSQFNYLIETAKKNRCAIIVIAHLNKMPGAKAIYRTTGSIDVVGAARSALLIAREDPESDIRIMVQQKSNLAPTGNGIKFSVGDGGIEYLEECNMTADEILGNYFKSSGRPDDELTECSDFIREMLTDGPLLSTECLNRLSASGHRERTAKKAKKNLGVVSVKQGTNWFWSLPS